MINKEKKEFTPIKIRNYTVNDYEAVKQNLEEGDLFDDVWDSEERLKKRIQEKSGSIILAILNEQVVGSVFIVDDFYPYIFRLAVRKAYRNQSIGGQLMDEAVRRLKVHGHEEVGLFVDEKNEELQEWYKRQNFKKGGLYRSMWKKI